MVWITYLNGFFLRNNEKKMKFNNYEITRLIFGNNDEIILGWNIT